MPGIEFDDGERVLGSRPIVRTLEHRAPEPPLLPLDARERRWVEEAEKWGDEVLQPRRAPDRVGRAAARAGRDDELQRGRAAARARRRWRA